MSTLKAGDLVAQINQRFGERLASRRTTMGLSPQCLNKFLSRRDGTVENFEKGVRKPDVLDLANLAKILDVSVDYFFEGEGLEYSLVGISPSHDEIIHEVETFLETYYQVSDKKLRHDILNLLRITSESEDYGQPEVLIK